MLCVNTRLCVLQSITAFILKDSIPSFVFSESLSADYFFLNKNPVFIPLYEDATPDNADTVAFDDAAPSV